MEWIQVEYNTPEGIYYWTLKDEIKTQFEFSEPIIDISLVSEDSLRKADLAQFDFDFIESIVYNIDIYILKSIQYIKADLAENAIKYGVETKLVHSYLAIKDIRFPVDFPNIVFYPDNSWLLRFADADFPSIEYCLGIGVSFVEYNPIDVNIYSIDEEI